MVEFLMAAGNAAHDLVVFAKAAAVEVCTFFYLALPVLMIIVVFDGGRWAQDVVARRLQRRRGYWGTHLSVFCAGWLGRLGVVGGLLLMLHLTALTMEIVHSDRDITYELVPGWLGYMVNEALMRFVLPLEPDFWRDMMTLSSDNPVFAWVQRYVEDMDSVEHWAIPFTILGWSIRWSLLWLTLMLWGQTLWMLLTLPKLLWDGWGHAPRHA